MVSGASAQVRFDPATLLQEFRWLSSDSLAGRAAGSPENRRAASYVEQVFRQTGLSAPEGGYVRPFSIKKPFGSIRAQNVIGYVEGREITEKYIVITAHFDHVGTIDGVIYNGADDNASGTAALLTLARYFTAHPLRHSLLLAALDAEEIGLHGARALMRDQETLAEAFVLNVNLDMISRNRGDSLYVVGTFHYPELKAPISEAAARSRIHLVPGHDFPGLGRNDWTHASDHAIFHNAGIPFVYFGVEDHADYHGPNDDFDRVTPGFYLRAVETILDAVETLDRDLSRAAESPKP